MFSAAHDAIILTDNERERERERMFVPAALTFSLMISVVVHVAHSLSEHAPVHSIQCRKVVCTIFVAIRSLLAQSLMRAHLQGFMCLTCEYDQPCRGWMDFSWMWDRDFIGLQNCQTHSYTEF